jgi:hypothetical protein
MVPTFAEQKLIKQTQKMLGRFLSSFLLTGYGEDQIIHSRFFYPHDIKHHDKKAKLVGMTTKDPAGLPSKREPLVLVALLSLLKDKDDGTGIYPVVPFPTEEIHEILGWENSGETDSIINTAIRKYFNISYVKAVDLSSSFDGATGINCNVSHLVVSHMFSSESELDHKMLENEVEDMACMEIGFAQEMIEELKAKRFLGIDWNSVNFLEQVIPK